MAMVLGFVVESEGEDGWSVMVTMEAPERALMREGRAVPVLLIKMCSRWNANTRTYVDNRHVPAPNSNTLWPLASHHL